MIQQPKARTIFWLRAVFIAMLFIGWSRLVYLQVFRYDQLTLLSRFNFLRLIKINPPRGNIIDCHQTLLATNRPVFLVYWQGSGNRALSAHQCDLIRQLATLLSFSITNILVDNISNAERYQRKVLLAKDISFAQISFIVEHLCYEPNILVTSDTQRHYPYQELASHVIGYLSAQNLDINGKMGLEKIYEQELKGVPGLKKQTVNATGKAMSEEDFQQYVAGKTIQTTIDLALQQFAEQSFDQNEVGSMIVMDPQTGALRVLLSRPSFNPEIFLRHISQEQWNELQETHFFINRSCQACYPPASLFKLVTIAAALEHAVVCPETTRICPGYYVFHDRPYHCNNRTGHGLVDIKQSLAQSCNIIFFEIGKKIDIDIIADYANRLGLGTKTGIIFPEKTGLIPSRAWKRLNKGESWWQGETLSVAVGQSFLLVTPLQIARMLGAIDQGYLVKPRILEDEALEREPCSIQASTRAFLKKCMKEAIECGTGQQVRNIPDLTIYGKTGTAQITSLERSNTTQDLRSHGWFVANFTYKDHAPLTLVIIVEHAGGSHKPAGIAKLFLKKYCKHIQNY
jgi:penicillin-binding protein 2